MKIKLDPYRVFNEVAAEKSLSAAAKKLYISQPAVSQSISQLEADLKVRLFTRTPKGVVLTNEGKILYEYVSAGINLIEKGERRIIDSRNLFEGELKIGVGDTIARHCLMDYLEEFNRVHPSVKLKIINRTTMELTSFIKSGDIDVALINLPLDEAGFEIIPTKSVRDVLVAGKKYSHLASKTIKLENLMQYPMIMLDERSRSRAYIESFLIANRLSVEPEIELGSHDLLLEFARIGLGLAFVVEEFSRDYFKDESIFRIQLSTEIPERQIGICHLEGVSLSPAAEKLINILQNM